MEVAIVDIFVAIGLNLLVATILILGLLALRWAQQTKDYELIRSFVRAAEQMMPGETGQDKMLWVLSQVRPYLPHLNDKLIRAFMEAAVYEMNEQKKERP